MLEICINRDTCLGYANCVLVAPDVFELDGDEIAVTLRNPIGTSQEEETVRSAAYDCPTNSITLVELADD